MKLLQVNTDFYIHYENIENSNELELKTLCKSLLGFELLLKEFAKISKIQAELEIKAKASKDGSYVEWLILGFKFLNALPFNHLSDFLDFIQIINIDLHKEATEFFNTHGFNLDTFTQFCVQIAEGKTKAQIFINDFAKNRPAEYDIIKWFLCVLTTNYYVKIFVKTKEVKNQKIPDHNTPLRFFKSLKGLIKKGSAKNAMRPFVENEIEKIGFSRNGKKVEEETIINRKNFGNFLPDSEEILSKYVNGSKHILRGEVKNFQSSRAEFMKIKVFFGKDGKHLLIVKPDEKHNTKDFIKFYQETVEFEAEILRESLFEKPQLKILGSMELVQKEMLLENKKD